ncbi:MAG: hypothetical protein AAFV96_00470 [Pseudomonadota bacterium]
MFLLAGVLGAHLATTLWPERASSGIMTLGLGLIAGTLSFVGAELTDLVPGVTAYLQILLSGGCVGALMALGVGSLRKILESRAEEPSARH